MVRWYFAVFVFMSLVLPIAPARADCAGGTCKAPVRKAVKAVAVAPVKVVKAKPVRKTLKRIIFHGRCCK